MHCGKVLTGCLALLVAPQASRAAEAITAANWRTHHAIVEIRAIYRETRQAEVAGRLRKEQSTLGHCRPFYEDVERTLHLDQSGAVRSFHLGGGSDDSAVQAAYYYDREGRLRFVFAEAGAVNGTSIEYRIYLSRTGERLWEEQRRLKGPGYTLPSRLPDEWLVRDPLQAFHTENACTGDTARGP
jgi:hypothetical protein